jgi:hypothetical protein
MSFGNIFKHMSPLYDAATGFTGTAAQNAMGVLGGKMMGGVGGQRMGINMPQPPMSEDEKRRKMLVDILMRGNQ